MTADDADTRGSAFESEFVMHADAVIQYISETFTGLDIVVASGYTFFFYDPGRKLSQDGRFPFATLVTEDNDYDRVSNLSRPGVFRLNIGVRKDTYRSLFGPQPSPPGASGVVNTGHGFAALDQLMPHPVYATIVGLHSEPR